MRKFLTLNLLLLISISAIAQLEVKKGSFKEVPGFVNINPDPNYQYDDNDKPFAVLKVLTENINEEQRARLLFQGDAQTFIMVENKVGEVWLYLSYYASYIKISHPDFSSTEYHFPFDMKPKCGYEITLINTAVQTNIGSGRLMITTKPENGATITMDGKVLSQKTPYTNDMIATGQHIVTVSKYGFEDITKNVVIENDLTTNIEIEMPYLFGSIRVESEPAGATVYIDNVNIGITPMTYSTIKYGIHELLVKKDNYSVYKNQFVVDNNELSHFRAVLQNYPNGAVSGVFSVSKKKQVYFSKGNLQYHRLYHNWRFAEHQWDVIGKASIDLPDWIDDWIDLFGWGTGNDPLKSSSNNSNYSDFVDWGNNRISNGEGYNWRTLTKREWKYILYKRKTDSGIRFVKATVNGIKGIIILPDNWSSSYYSLNNVNINKTGNDTGRYDDKVKVYFDSNIISLSDWISKFENNGAVFLPAINLGYRYTMGDHFCCFYWSSTPRSYGRAYDVQFYDSYPGPRTYQERYYDNSVRLVCDLE